MNGFYTPPQRNFDGSAVHRAQQAQLQAAYEATPDSALWAERATYNAKRALQLLGNAKFDAVMAHFSDAWFETRTWRAQSEAFSRLHLHQAQYPAVELEELIGVFGEPDI